MPGLQMDNDSRVSWERFLNPETLRTNLIVASLFITAFEMLKDCIIDRIKDFFTSGFNQNGWVVDEKYNTEVLSRNQSQLYASLDWLKDMDVIDKQDIKRFDKMRQCRNELAHEIANFISRGSKIDPLPLFSEISYLLFKIEKWWIINVEIPTNPEFDDKHIEEDGIVPGRIMTLRLLMDIALGTEEESKISEKARQSHTNLIGSKLSNLEIQEGQKDVTQFAAC